MEYNEQAIREAMRLAKTPAGQQLLNMLQQNSSEDLRRAMEKAAAGDMSQAKQAVSAMLKDPQVQKLLEQMGGK